MKQKIMALLHVFPENLCIDGHVRLVGGLVDSEGTVEFCQNGSWNSLCNTYWGYQEAFVVCRQLGLPATGEKLWTLFSQCKTVSFTF